MTPTCSLAQLRDIKVNDCIEMPKLPDLTTNGIYLNHCSKFTSVYLMSVVNISLSPQGYPVDSGASGYVVVVRRNSRCGYTSSSRGLNSEEPSVLFLSKVLKIPIPPPLEISPLRT